MEGYTVSGDQAGMLAPFSYKSRKVLASGMTDDLKACFLVSVIEEMKRFMEAYPNLIPDEIKPNLADCLENAKIHIPSGRLVRTHVGIETVEYVLQNFAERELESVDTEKYFLRLSECSDILIGAMVPEDVINGRGSKYLL